MLGLTTTNLLTLAPSPGQGTELTTEFIELTPHGEMGTG